ncbi:hypothetical protein N9383_03140 [Granulosicoccus sp.]|nr:hypothetical protein [Granulosicoccus sp.]
MSDIILKYWPTYEVSMDKTRFIVEELKSQNILGDEIKFWGNPAYTLGIEAVRILAPHLSVDGSEIKNFAVFVKQEDYGIGFSEDDFEYIDRRNVITVNGGDGDLVRSKEFCNILLEITGDEYSTEFEML